jgi:hypothetical protein
LVYVSHAHDGLEDALAARELVLWCLRHPVELEAWAAETRRSFWLRRAGRSAKSKGKVVPQAPLENYGRSDSDGSNEVILVSGGVEMV